MVALEAEPAAPLIAAPGRYRIAMDRYHAQCCDGPSVSGSTIWEFHHRSPAHCFASWSGNPDRETKDSAAFVIGRAAHLFALNDGSFDASFAVLPFPDRRTKEARDWCAAQELAGRSVLTAAEAETVSQMAAALLASPLVRAAFKDGEGELSYIWKDAATGIWLKARPDWTSPAPRPVYDLKFHADGSPDAFNRDAFKFGYHVKAALALDGIAAVMGERRAAYSFIVCEKAAPFVTQLYAIEAADLDYGRAIIRRTLDRMARCIETGRWPGYGDDVLPLLRPRWLDAEAEALCDQELDHG